MVFVPLQIQKQREGKKEDCSKKRLLMEVLCNLLPSWLKRLRIIPFYSLSSFTMSKFNQLFTLKEVALEDPIEEYAEDIHSFYRLLERKNQPGNYLGSYSGITARVRTSLVNLIVRMHEMLQLSPETLYLTVSIFDRFLAQETVARVQLKLVAICAMHIASKYKETHAPLLQDFTDIWMLRYSTSDVLKMENRILNRIEWSLSLPTPYMFIVRYINIEDIDKETECMIFFYAEMALTQDYLLEACPSLVAASCVYTARCTLKKSPLWTKALERCTRYAEPYLLECARILMYAHLQAAKSTESSVYDKYSLERYKKVALHAPAEVDAWDN